MSEHLEPTCSDCEGTVEQPLLHRRGFIRVLGGGTAAAVGLGALPATPMLVRAADKKEKPTTAPVKKPEKPAEALIKELYAGLSDTQKKEIVLAWDHGKAKQIPTRLGMYNAPIGKKIGDAYTKPQQELLERILRAIASDDEGYRRITRNGTFDNSGAFTNCGAYIFGDPSGAAKYAWLFTGHHLTVRCDGNSEEGAAFGGPMYYGHSPNGYSDRNVFNYQTKAVLSVFEALSEKQRKVAIVKGSPGEQAPSVKFRGPKEAKPGISYGELSKDQQALVESVMRAILSPYRQEDVDEVMEIVKTNGGMAKIHLAFYPDAKMKDSEPWHFWRLEGPGFVWNYRVLPHVHTFVNISSKV